MLFKQPLSGILVIRYMLVFRESEAKVLETCVKGSGEKRDWEGELSSLPCGPNRVSVSLLGTPEPTLFFRGALLGTDVQALVWLFCCYWLGAVPRRACLPLEAEAGVALN